MIKILSMIEKLKALIDLEMRKRSENGNVMIIVVGTMLVLGLIAIAVVTYVYSNQNLVVNERRETKSLHAADAGFNKAIWLITQLKSQYGPVSSVDFVAVLASYDTDPSSPGIDMVATVDTTQGIYTYQVKVQQGNGAFGWGVQSIGLGPKGVKEKIVASVDAFSIWDFNFSGSSVNAGGAVTGNVTIHGPFYVRGNLELSGNTGYYDGPLYVKTEQALPGLTSQGADIFNDSLSGDIDIDGSGMLGEDSTVKIYVDSECPDCDTNPPCDCDVTYGPGILDIPLPVLNTPIMQARYLGADLLLDSLAPPGVPVLPADRKAGSFDVSSGLTITYGVTDSFDYIGTDDISGDGLTGRLKWDKATNTLTISGTVFIDGDLDFEGSNNEHIVYSGIGTIYTSGNITVDSEVLRASNIADFPVTSALGLVTTETIEFNGNNCTGCDENNPGYQVAAFGSTHIHVEKQVHIKGTLISKLLTFKNVPDLYTQGNLSANLPPDLPGDDGDNLITQILGWHEVPIR